MSDHGDAGDTSRRDDRGWKSYRPWVLAAYDPWVHGISDRWFWHCPPRLLSQLYDDHLSRRHLEMGVGTGTLLASSLRRRSQMPETEASAAGEIACVTLADANPDCLKRAARSVSPWLAEPPTCLRVDLRDAAAESDAPIARRFDSAALVYLLHCIPHESGKRGAIRYAAARLSAEGVCFGATLVGQPPARQIATRWLERRYRRAGIFANESDDQECIATWLRSEFREVELRQQGRVVLFVARQPR